MVVADIVGLVMLVVVPVVKCRPPEELAYKRVLLAPAPAVKVMLLVPVLHTAVATGLVGAAGVPETVTATV